MTDDDVTRIAKALVVVRVCMLVAGAVAILRMAMGVA